MNYVSRKLKTAQFSIPHATQFIGRFSFGLDERRNYDCDEIEPQRERAIINGLNGIISYQIYVGSPNMDRCDRKLFPRESDHCLGGTH